MRVGDVTIIVGHDLRHEALGVAFEAIDDACTLPKVEETFRPTHGAQRLHAWLQPLTAAEQRLQRSSGPYRSETHPRRDGAAAARGRGPCFLDRARGAHMHRERGAAQECRAERMEGSCVGMWISTFASDIRKNGSALGETTMAFFGFAGPCSGPRTDVAVG